MKFSHTQDQLLFHLTLLIPKWPGCSFSWSCFPRPLKIVDFTHLPHKDFAQDALLQSNTRRTIPFHGYCDLAGIHLYDTSLSNIAHFELHGDRISACHVLLPLLCPLAGDEFDECVKRCADSVGERPACWTNEWMITSLKWSLNWNRLFTLIN